MSDLVDGLKYDLEQFAVRLPPATIARIREAIAALEAQPRLPDDWKTYSGTTEEGQRYVGMWSEKHDINARVYDFEADERMATLRLLITAFLPQPAQPESVKAERESLVESRGCYDCGRHYGDQYGFPDLIIPYDAWVRISPTGNDGGLLCPSCICKRLDSAGIKCEGAFMSGPIISVSAPTMYALRRIENIELAIEGRNNTYSGIREMVRKLDEARK